MIQFLDSFAIKHVTFATQLVNLVSIKFLYIFLGRLVKNQNCMVNEKIELFREKYLDMFINHLGRSDPCKNEFFVLIVIFIFTFPSYKIHMKTS